MFGALLTVLGTIGTALVATIRWAVTRITKALDDNSAAHNENAKQMAILSTKIDHVYQASERVREFVTEERSGVHESPMPRQRKTPVGGIQSTEYLLTRHKRSGDG